MAVKARSQLVTVATGDDDVPARGWLDEDLGRNINATELEEERDTDEKVGFLEWATAIPEPKTGTLNFERFPFQWELYAEGVEVPDVTIMKSTQVGASAWLARWALYWPDVHGLTSMYVFPADEQMGKFSNQRIAPLLRSAALAGHVPSGHVNNVHQRQVGRGWLNLAGARSEAGLESVDADVLALDEYDLIPATSIPLAERRISSPMSKGLIRKIGWPSVDEYGIALNFDRSDRRRWFVKCGRCSTRQFVRFFKRNEGEIGQDNLPNAPQGYVDKKRGKLVCGKCEKQLAADDVQHGEWVAEYPERERRGYHIHRLLVPGTKLDGLIDSAAKTDAWEIQSFWNRDLGEPFSPKEGRLSRAAIAAAQSAGGGYLQGGWDVGYYGDGVVTMGIDSASERNLNVRISLHDGKRKRALFIGEVSDWNRLAEMMDIYRVRMAAVDHLPDGRLAKGFAQRFFGRVYVCHFLPPTANDLLTFDPEERKAAIKRTEAIDATLGLVRSTRNQLPVDLPEGYVEHMRNVVRFHEVDELGRRVVGYKSLGPIDYLMGEVYDFLARELLEVEVIRHELADESYTTLDQHFEFERSHLEDPASLNDEYRAGPGGDEEYSPGFDSD